MRSYVMTFNENIDYSIKNNAAGLAIIYENSILLVHPTNASWKKPTLGIPKGKLEEGEDFMAAAIREVFEETGIIVDRDLINPAPHTTYLYDKQGNKKKQLVYYVVDIESLDEIGLDSKKVPKGQLQQEEIDWAKFVKIKKAYELINYSQKIILDRHLKLS